MRHILRVIPIPGDNLIKYLKLAQERGMTLNDWKSSFGIYLKIYEHTGWELFLRATKSTVITFYCMKNLSFCYYCTLYIL